MLFIGSILEASTESIAMLPPFGPIVVFPDFQPMRVSEEPICLYLFQQNLAFTSLHLRSPVHVVPPQDTNTAIYYIL